MVFRGSSAVCETPTGTLMSWDEARAYSEMKNSTLPIITDEDIDKAFQQFIVNDSSSVIQNGSVWLGAYARPINESVNWHWMNGQPSDLTSSNFSNSTDNSHDSWYATIGKNAGRTQLYENCWTSKKHYICQYDAVNETSSSTTNDGCSPRWIVHHDLAAGGGWPLPWSLGTSQQACLDFCVANSSCVSAEWNVGNGCWIHFKRRRRDPRPGVTQFEIVRRCNVTSDRTCGNTFQLGSSCYKVHKNETVNWFTAVNRCRSLNASLAVFDDKVREYFPSTVLSAEQAWIGLLKSRWTWPGSDGTDVMFNKFSLSGASSPPNNTTQHSNVTTSDLHCVVAVNGVWKLSDCNERHGVVCQSDEQVPVESTTTSTTTTITTTTTTTTTTATTTVATTSSSAAAETMATTTGISSVSQSATTEDDKSSVGLAVGLSFVFVVLLIIVVVVVVVVLRRRNSSSSQEQHQLQLMQLQLTQFYIAEQDKSTDANRTGDQQKPEVVYADIVKPANKGPEVVYVNIPDPQLGAVAPPNSQNDNAPVVYSELHTCDLSDLYAKVSR